MTKKTGLANATTKPKDPEAWVAEKPNVAANQTTEKPARLVVELPVDLHRQLKGKCGSEGLKIKTVIEQLLRDWVNA